MRELLAEVSAKYPGKRVAFVSHQGPQLALDVIVKGKTWQQAFAEDWRHTKEWKPGWKYVTRASTDGGDIYCGTTAPEGEGWEQDPDTLDTWFSSGLWTFSTLGWPDETDDLKTYHPTAVLETGYDILFFWVARMVLMSGFLRGQVPFKNVYLHGLVRDAKGRKMSKSLGNIIDPLDMSTKYGADATRLSLIIGAQIGNDLKLDENRVRGYKHFANKLWNISRFVLENAQGADMTAPLTDTDAGLITEAEGIVASVSANIDGFRLDLAADTVYHFVWDRFAAEILEQTKPIMRGEDEAAKASAQRMLYTILIMSLKLLHPFMPFVTEAIWQELPDKDADMLMVSKWPAGRTSKDFSAIEDIGD
jgi:valyl-tRNA synthetase